MKKIVVLASIVASVLMLASCSSQGTSAQAAPAAQPDAASHHDYKGELK